MFEESKTRIFTLQELRGLHAYIKWNEEIDPWSLWNEEQQLRYVLNLLLGNYQNEHPIYLQTPNYDEIDLNDYNTLFTNHTFSPIPNKPGSEELWALYGFTNDELDLQQAKNFPKLQNLLNEFERDVKEYGKATNLTFSKLPRRYRLDVVFKQKTTVIILPQPSTQTSPGDQ